MSEALNLKLHKRRKETEMPPPPQDPLPSNFDLLEFDAEDNELLEKFLNAN